MQTNTASRVENARTVLRNKATKTEQKNGELGKNEFMNLFLTQVSHQNPTDPMDSGAMMTQLAQLGSMEQLEKMNTGIQALNAKQLEMNRINSLNYLGKDIMVEADQLELNKGSSKPILFDLGRDVHDLRVIIEEPDGSPVMNRQLGLLEAGKQQFLWDGKNNEGTAMADGKYKIRLLAQYPDGSVSPVQPHNIGRVSNVEHKDGKSWVKMQGKSIPLDAVRSIEGKSKHIFGNAAPMPMMKELPTKGAILKNLKG